MHQYELRARFTQSRYMGLIQPEGDAVWTEENLGILRNAAAKNTGASGKR